MKTTTGTNLIIIALAAASSLVGAGLTGTRTITTQQGRIITHETTNAENVKRFILGRGWSAAHFVFGGRGVGAWQTTFAVTNSTSTVKKVSLLFVDDNGMPLQVPLLATKKTAVRVDLEMNPNATIFVDTDDESNIDGTWGTALLFREDDDYTGLASQLIFRQSRPGGQTAEGTVPFESRGASQCNGPLVMQYDEAFGFVMGFALANLDPNPGWADVEAYNDLGERVGSTSISLEGVGHGAWLLDKLIPATSGGYGHLKITRRTEDCNGQIGALGLRFSPSGSFTTVFPMLDKEPAELVASEPALTFSLTLNQIVFENAAGIPPLLRGRLTLRNKRLKPFTLSFRSSQQFDFLIKNSAGKIMYQWSSGQIFTFGSTTREIADGEANWMVETSLPRIVQGLGAISFPAGFYTAEAFLTSSPGFSAAMGFEIR